MRKLLLLIALVLSLAAFPNSSFGQRAFGDILNSTTARRTEAVVSPCASGKEADLPLPSKFLPNKLPEFQALVKTFLTSSRYKNLNWCEDKALRDTGPFVNGVSYGVHPSVKIYYSPSVINWLLNNNSGQLIPDGAMIVKEQYPPPAAQVSTPVSAVSQRLDHHDQGFERLEGWLVLGRVLGHAMRR